MPNGVVLDISQGQVLAGAQNELPKFEFVGTGNGWEYRYDGHLTRNWGKPPDANRVDQRPTLVGSVIGVTPPSTLADPFIAVKQ